MTYTYQVFFTWKRRGRDVRGMDELTAASPRAAIKAARERSDTAITVTGLLEKKRSYWQEIPLTPELIAA